MRPDPNTIRLLCGFLLLAILSPLTPAAADPDYVGSTVCSRCHEQAWNAWRSSHHYRSMLPASAESVLGAFDGRRFEYGGVRSRFFRAGSKYLVETDDADGELRVFEVAYTFGFHPLQQYLIAFPGGRYQALNIVWDSRPQEAGGQRWMHLYPEGTEGNETPVTHEDIVHWTGSFQNWNSRCAACHSTRLEKKYSASSHSYSTSWAEINVACEACHGPAAGHLAWADPYPEGQENGAEAPAFKGFAYSLDDRGAFGPAAAGDAGRPERLDGKRPAGQVETCAGCHARRSEMDEDHAGKGFNDLYRLALIEPGLYFADGQIRDEVYVYGSFLQSRMHAAGVVCSNCHDAHTNAVRVRGNGLCTQCHAAAAYDQPGHHRHEQDSAGAACVECHMPARTYMVVDDRRDHSFRVPRPGLSVELGVPNACNGCHRDRDAPWAVAALQAWGVGGADPSPNAAPLADAWSGKPAALPRVLALATDAQAPAILRASAVRAAADYPPRETLQAVTRVLWSDDALVRSAAVRALDQLPPEQRYALLKSLVGDPAKSVRMAVAKQLSGLPANLLPAAEAQALSALMEEYVGSLRLNADMPEEQMNFGLYYTATGDLPAAEQAYREALRLAPAFVPAMMNLADLYRASGLDDQARPLLEKAVNLAPQDAAPWHAMGLLLIRQRELDAALEPLRRAAQLDPDRVRYGYVYAVALWEAGQRRHAVEVLESVLAGHPGDRDIIAALASYYNQLGETEKLRALQQP